MEDKGYISIEGTVQSVIFQNEENGYTVLRLRTENGAVTAVGCFPGISVGEQLRLTGSWTAHQSYGQQFKSEFYESSLPSTEEAIFEYLSSGIIKGIGAKTAQLIVSQFGRKTLEVIEDEPERLTEIRGISPRRAKEIGRLFRRRAGLRRLLEFFASYGVRPFAAARLYRDYGEEAKAAVVANPYLLADEYYGLDFFEADEFALKLGFDGGCSERIEAAVLFELRHNLKNGHTFLPREKLTMATAQLLNTDPEPVSEAITDLGDGGYVIEDQIAGVDAVYLYEMHEAEEQAAKFLWQMVSLPRAKVKKLETLLQQAEKACEITFAGEQRRALKMAAENGVMVLTGGPGTGKTTAVRGILELFDQMELTTLITAPTGRAAKRMSELTGREAQTVHRLLGACAPEANTGKAFQKCASDPLECDAVILDETSMMDISLLCALLDAMPLSARLIMVGDADQLPSVGPGNVFSDVIRSEAVPVVRLHEIFRQAQESDIVKNAHLINQGETPGLKNSGGDFYFLQRLEPRTAAETIVGLVAERLPKNMNIPPREIQVLSPSRKRACGTFDLNTRIQAAINPPGDGKKEKAVGNQVFRVGDRVMQTRNNYDIMWYKQPTGTNSESSSANDAGCNDAPQNTFSGTEISFSEEKDTAFQVNKAETGTGVFNGDVGYIEDINEEQEFVLISFDDRLTPYPFEMLTDLELSYAMTVHKSQGSEYRAVILALTGGVPQLQTRSVLYTAITRARELFITVGGSDIMDAMVKNDRRQRRYSGLRARLAAEAQC